jgi:hypothetical protein
MAGEERPLFTAQRAEGPQGAYFGARAGFGLLLPSGEEPLAALQEEAAGGMRFEVNFTIFVSFTGICAERISFA